jgi:hypothetical protein
MLPVGHVFFLVEIGLNLRNLFPVAGSEINTFFLAKVYLYEIIIVHDIAVELFCLAREFKAFTPDDISGVNIHEIHIVFGWQQYAIGFCIKIF